MIYQLMSRLRCFQEHNMFVPRLNKECGRPQKVRVSDLAVCQVPRELVLHAPIMHACGGVCLQGSICLIGFQREKENQATFGGPNNTHTHTCPQRKRKVEAGRLSLEVDSTGQNYRAKRPKTQG